MDEEQIKQNAEAYADAFCSRDDQTGMWQECCNIFIAGAHSRDEEIERLQNQIEELSDQLKMNAENIQKLRNPWKDASVEKPPYDTDCDDETSVYVIVRQEQGNVLEAYYDYDNGDWRDREHNWRLQDPTHWMPIPELRKGELK